MIRFFDLIFPPRVDELALRSVSIEDFLTQVVPRVVPETRPETVVLLPFEVAVVRAAIHEAKYHGSSKAFKFLAAALAEYLRDADDIRKAIIVPVPLGKERLRERGFNQVEEIARLAVEELDITMDATILKRTRETISQVSLPRRAREENMRGAFLATHSVDPAYTYIVIDDVITTGATLQAAIDALKEAGAEHIIPLALAH
jgi:ComF family protein